MPTNTYFTHGVKSEQNLYEDLIIESVQIYGHDVYYLPRDIIEEDKILNEEVTSKFSNAYIIEMYLKELEGFEGDGDILSKFGIQIKDQCTLVVSRKRWEQLVKLPNNDIDQVRPFEGDLIYIPLSKSLFEIRFVEDQVPFFQLGNVPVYELRCELFTYEDQNIDTGVDEIDVVESNQASISNVLITVTAGSFQVGEKLTLTTGSGATITAEYTKFQKTDTGEKIFSLTNITYPNGQFIPLSAGISVVGDESGAEGVIGTVIGLNDSNYSSTSNDKFQDNDVYEKKIEDFIDFSTDNPFGDL